MGSIRRLTALATRVAALGIKDAIVDDLAAFLPTYRSDAPKLGPQRLNAPSRRQRRAQWRSGIYMARIVYAEQIHIGTPSNIEKRPTKASKPWHASGLTMSGNHRAAI